jgi:hypothetical protein
MNREIALSTIKNLLTLQLNIANVTHLFSSY